MYDSKPSDEQVTELIVAMGRGERAALDELYKSTSSPVFSALMRILRDRSDAEDALQNVYVKAWRGATRFREDRSAMAWLLTIARNEAVDMLRARRRRGEAHPVPDDLVDGLSGTEHRFMLRQRIVACLRKLSRNQADAILCVYQLGYSYREMAERAGVPENTVRTRLHRGLRLLRACLGGEDDAEPRGPDDGEPRP
ncbi:MAG: sigma-70 family RNA polymerase sigma factor [Pseudooceanicola nanhaiensis]|uniref:sigma-70 family RNA polymerase sigma factor n=1 Tax=Marinibacterium profundimaris TaxID=1679460 RepID=UPI001303A0D9|nr:sigma-70 family RNA polymerase sigma factor [Marinibacterium profundimaris]